MCGFIAQLVEHRTDIAEVMGSNPVEALIFFQASSFQLPKLENLLRRSHFTFRHYLIRSVVIIDGSALSADLCRGCTVTFLYISNLLVYDIGLQISVNTLHSDRNSGRFLIGALLSCCITYSSVIFEQKKQETGKRQL